MGSEGVKQNIKVLFSKLITTSQKLSSKAFLNFVHLKLSSPYTIFSLHKIPFSRIFLQLDSNSGKQLAVAPQDK